MTKYCVTGMTCAACSAHVEKAVRSVEGVEDVTVSLLTNSMSVDGQTAPDLIIRAVEKAGYGASIANTAEKTQTGNSVDSLKDHETPILKKRLLSSLLFLIPLMYLSMGHMMWGWPLPAVMADNHIAMGITQLLFTGIIMVINQKFFISGVTSLLHKAPNMDTLVAMGAAAAFGYSTYALYAMTDAMHRGDMAGVDAYMMEFYFESAAMILTLITFGKLLEAYSKGKTTDALKNLMKLTPQTATLLIDGQEQTVGIEQVMQGSIFVVKPGESIPVDGVIIEGSCALDESALTGESIPVDKEAGMPISAATINRSGFITCKATRVGQDTTLSQIIQMVSDAAATKAPIAKVADKVSGIFVPVVLGIAFVTLLIWLFAGQSIGFALARAISVLVISCPCALGLATPVAIMVGNGKGAKNGILFKTAAALEATGKTRIIALDKTGTLTNGKPVVTDIIAVEKEEQLLEVAYSLEAKSEHPLANAIMEYGKEHKLAGLPTTEFQVAPGNGLTATIEGKKAAGGNRRFIETQTAIPTQIREQAEKLAGEGKTPLYFVYDSKLLGIIAVADVLKENAKEVIGQLEKMGIEVVMLTGDNKRTAEAIGKQAGISHVIAEVLPTGKEEEIRKLACQGKVAMVGDGINDAPALTRADVGIAIGAGTDVAIDAADVILVKSALEDIPAAIRLSRQVLRNIHENLFWAFFYNVLGIPLAAGAWIHLTGWEMNPMFGAAAMSLSSFCVVTNALRLNLVNVYSSKKDRKLPHKQITKLEKEKKTVMKTMQIKGMMCGHCEARVKKALEAVQGVTEAQVSYESGTAVVSMDYEVNDDLLTKTVEEQDYEVISITNA